MSFIISGSELNQKLSSQTERIGTVVSGMLTASHWDVMIPVCTRMFVKDDISYFIVIATPFVFEGG